MELELGLKITHTRDDLTSTTNLQVTKDHSGPLFVSKEIDTMFILEGHLKGIRKENIDVDINKDGNRITISGKKPVQEMVLMGWIMHKKEAVMRTFEKSFRIPDGVKLDRIKAKFNDETSVLTIRMPKRVKGISGVGIEEVEEEEVDKGRPTETVADKVPERESPKEIPQESTSENIDQVETRRPPVQQVVADEIPEQTGNLEVPKDETSEKFRGMEDSGPVMDQGQSEEAKIPERDDDHKETMKEKPEEIDSRKLEDVAKVEPAGRVQEPIEESNEPEGKRREDNDQVVEKPQGSPENELQDQPLTKPEPYLEPEAEDQTIRDKVNGEDQTEGTKETPTCAESPSQEKTDKLECRKEEKQKSLSEEAGQGTKAVPKKSKVCTPIVVAGSAILVSIIVLVIHFIRAKKR